MAMPLALAMSVNGLFIIGMVFVPGLWSVIEYLFPLALGCFRGHRCAYGFQTVCRRFWGASWPKAGSTVRPITTFGQVLPAFAFAMIGVGLAAPAAMSANACGRRDRGWCCPVFFFMVAAVLIAIAGVPWCWACASMMENGANAETAPTLSMIVVPLLAVLGILMPAPISWLAHAFRHGDLWQANRCPCLSKLLSGAGDLSDLRWAVRAGPSGLCQAFPVRA
jgi:hypothetical protein